MDDAEASWKRSKTAMLAWFIDSYHALYIQSRNPFHALEAYRMVRAAKIDVPDWIFEVFDQWADTLCIERPKGASAIAAALGLVGTGGGPSITAQAKKQTRNLRIARRVFELRNSAPERDKLDVFHQVADEFSLSSERVASIWYEVIRGSKAKP